MSEVSNNKKKDKPNIDKLKESGVVPCAKCALFSHISPENQTVRILLTLSPNPQWQEYAERLPDTQHRLITKVLYNSDILQKLKKYFSYYSILSTHYEFQKNGNLHTHSIVEIPKKYEGYDRNLMTISKMYHRKIGLQYNNCQISANTKWITDDDIFYYLNKENAYTPIHDEQQITLLNYLKTEPTTIQINNATLPDEETDSDTE